jgi:hypothetical protein
MTEIRDDTLAQIDLQAVETLAKYISDEGERDIATDTYYFGLIFREYLLDVVNTRHPQSKLKEFLQNDILYRALLIGAIPLAKFGVSKVTKLITRR